ncbi:MAG TPA: tetratricopeptide repeat protein [Aquificaceae bacterium]|nr:tetratricopeptide repeat protein [Aquificaceae bacterium]
MKRVIFLFLTFISACTPTKHKEQHFWKVYYDLGTAAFYAKNYSEAIAHFHRALRVNSDEPRIWNSLGLAYMEVKEYKKAEESFKKALNVDSQFTEAKMNLGILYMRMKKYNLAIKYLEEAARDELFEKKHIAFYHLAQAYKKLGNFRKYVKSLEKAVAYNPTYVEAQLELAKVYEEAGDYKKAEEIYKSLMRNGYKNNYILYKLAEVYYKAKEYNKAKRIIKELFYNPKLTEEQKEKVNELLDKILIEQQRKIITSERPVKRKKDIYSTELQRRSVENGTERKYYAVQIGAFSNEERAKRFIYELNQKGLKDLTILKIDGIYKVVYGKFNDLEKALEAREDLRKKTGIYGFVVEVK